MTTKIWQKTVTTSEDHLKIIEKFTVGNDLEFDLLLAKYDVLGSLAHCEMLHNIHLLTIQEWRSIEKELREILESIEKGNFILEEGMEDIHSQIEYFLINKIGETGKKIHSGRSRNDQVLTDIKLYLKDELKEITALCNDLFLKLIKLSNEYQADLLPGYTHLQIAMPSSFGLWFGAYAESLTDDLEMISAAYRVVDKNPLGSAAGYGNSFPLDRELTTKILNFSDMNINSVYAQMSRGKTEKIVGMALANIAGTLSKFAYDICLYLNQNFGFISFPDTLTTGSSIMPHKKNPDVFELIRAKCNLIQSIPNELVLLTNNLPSGYHRDVQLTKQILFPKIIDLKESLKIFLFMLEHININKDILSKKEYKYLFSVEEVNKEVLKGVSFRDAYIKIGKDIENDTFMTDTNTKHTHIGSIGNLGNEKIEKRMATIIKTIIPD